MPEAPPTLQELLERLEQLRRAADQSFARVARGHPHEVACRQGCDDCCHALFDLSPIEALSLARAFAGLDRKTRRGVRRAAEKAARAFDQFISGSFGAAPQEQERLLSRARVRCPLLDKGRCLLYQARPITCRLYGVPTAVGGQSHTCRFSRFAPGQSYPTADLGAAQDQLEELSAHLRRLFPNLPPGRIDVARAINLKTA